MGGKLPLMWYDRAEVRQPSGLGCFNLDSCMSRNSQFNPRAWGWIQWPRWPFPMVPIPGKCSENILHQNYYDIVRRHQRSTCVCVDSFLHQWHLLCTFEMIFSSRRDLCCQKTPTFQMFDWTGGASKPQEEDECYNSLW